MAQDTFGSPSAAPAQPAPKGAFGAGNGGVQNFAGPSPDGGSPPNSGRQHEFSNLVGGVQNLRDGSPDGGSPPNTHQGGNRHSALNGGSQRIPADRTPESGDGQGA